MNTVRHKKLLVFLLSLGLSFSTFQAASEDIDLFTVDEGGQVNKPNVLIILDNSANWSRAAQKWPDEPTQGQAEVRAIQTVINSLDENINVGLMMYITGGSAADTDSGYVRFHIRPMNATNKADLSARLDAIYNNINDPIEKRSQGNPFGNLFWDAYNYLSGANHSNAGIGTPASLASAGAYATQWSRFRSPLTDNDNCTQTTIIFIGNNTSSGPTGDSTANVNALAALGGVTTPQIKFKDFSCSTTPTTTDLGYSTSCYSNDSTCSTGESNATCLANGFTSCTCSATSPQACTSLTHFKGKGTTTTTTIDSDDNPGVTSSGQSTGDILQCSKNKPNPIACPSPRTDTFPNTPSAGKTTSKTTSWTTGSCDYVSTGVNCGGQKVNWELRGTKTVRTVVTTSTPVEQDLAGETAQCYLNVGSCSTTSFAGCPGGPTGSPTYSSCRCTDPGSPSGCDATTSRFRVTGNSTSTACVEGNTFSTPPTQGGNEFMSDEWARFLSQTGVTLPGGAKAQVKTHTIDVFNAQQDATQSKLLFSIARVSGGNYYQAKTKNQIQDALTRIFAEVQAVNSAFASASLPINATNRAQNENQVFLGLFKPGRTKQPLWFGNLKKFQLVISGGEIKLGDKNGNPAVNDDTGFLHECSESFWSVDSGQYWFFTTKDDPDARGTCATSANDVHSDAPDGPFAEKGGASQVLRLGNTTGTPDGEGNYALTRNIKTLSGNALVDFTPPIAGIADDFVTRFIRGEDTENDDLDAGARSLTEPRSTIHGDVIHSRPLPISYTDGTGVVVYYGANDGTFRAIKSNTGQELWSFVAPEHYGKFLRLKQNTPLVKYFGDTAPGLVRRDYFFDGGTGLYQNQANTEFRIFTTQRRGGRRIYSFDVSNPVAPAFAWSRGCPNQTDDTNCDAGFAGIGQTWSTPNVAFIRGYPALGAETPVIIMGGGYDICEDANTPTPSCSAAKGRVVYVLNALTGAIIKAFDLSSVAGTRSIAADVALIDMNNDKFVDHAYAVDTGGSFYRMDLNGVSTPADPAEWAIQRIAFTTGAGRKFLFPPALVQATSNIVYLAIGSGDREAPLAGQYPFTTAPSGVINRMYVFKDNVSVVANPDLATALASGFSLDDTSNMINHTSSPGTCSDEKVLPASSKKGWFIDLTASGRGEQTVTSAVIATGFVFLSTNRPTPDAQTSVCTNSLGEARGYFVSLLNGAGSIGIAGACTDTPNTARRSSVFTGGGLPPSPVLATVPVAGKIRTVIIGAVGKNPTNDADHKDSPINPGELTPTITATRTPVYWFKSTGDN
jgi:Tfp pilus tip-associated adhesin PilY1